ncbi:hypothetical protein JCM6882_000869 [Rhodosporidiobolus microsporus]
MPSRFSALVASSRPAPTAPSSSSSSSPNPSLPAPSSHLSYAHHPLSLSHLHLSDAAAASYHSRIYAADAGGMGRGGEGQGSLVGGGRAGFFSTSGEGEEDEREGRRRFSLAMSEDAEVPQLHEAAAGGWFSPSAASPAPHRHPSYQQHHGGEQYTYAPRQASYSQQHAHSRQPTYQTLDALLAASSSAGGQHPSSSYYAHHSTPPQQHQHQHDIGGDFSFASSFGLSEEGVEPSTSPTVALEDVSPVSPSSASAAAASLFEQQEYYSPSLSTAGASGRELFGSAPAYHPSQQQQQQCAAYSSAAGQGSVPIPLSRPTAAPIGAFLPSSAAAGRDALSESPYQPFAFSPSSFSAAPSSAPAGYPSHTHSHTHSHSLTGAFLPSSSSASAFTSSTPPTFSTLSDPSVPPSAPVPASASPLVFAPPAPGNRAAKASGPGILAAYRRATYGPSSTAYSPSLTSASPPSPPRSSGSLLAAAFGPSPLSSVAMGNAAARLSSSFNNTPPSPGESFLSASPPLVSSFGPSSAPSTSTASRPYPPITSSPASSFRPSSTPKRKKRSSSASAAYGGADYDPDYEERLRNRPISPITGKPTKIIAKRGWPPKDAAKRVYRCEVEGCGKSFGRPSARDTHMRSHNGAKPFTCPIPACARSFSVFSNLKRHMIVHPTVDFRSVAVHDLPLIQWVDDPEDPDGAGGRLEWIEELPDAAGAGAGSREERSEEEDDDEGGMEE